jgi:hypothetical protein
LASTVVVAVSDSTDPPLHAAVIVSPPALNTWPPEPAVSGRFTLCGDTPSTALALIAFVAFVALVALSAVVALSAFFAWSASFTCEPEMFALSSLSACFLAIDLTFDLVSLLATSVPATAVPTIATASAATATSIQGDGRCLTPPDDDRRVLLDRLAERMPDLDLTMHKTDWMTMPPPDNHEALLANGGGIDGGDGVYFANAGEDVHAVGSTSALIPGTVGCVVIKPDGSRHLARIEADPLSNRN